MSSLSSPDAAEEVASLARSLGLDTSDYSVVGGQTQQKLEKEDVEQEDVEMREVVLENHLDASELEVIGSEVSFDSSSHTEVSVVVASRAIKRNVKLLMVLPQNKSLLETSLDTSRDSSVSVS